MKLLSGLLGFSLAKSVPLNQAADRDVESLEGIFDEMEINEKLHLDLFEGDILGRFSRFQSATYRVIWLVNEKFSLKTTKGGPDDAASRNIQKDLTLRWPEWVYEFFLIFFSRHETKAWTAGPYRKSGPVRILVRGPDFWSEISWSGPWSGFSVRIFVGPVRGPEFGPDSNLVRSVVRILVRKNPYRGGFFFGPVRGPDQNSEKLKK